MRALLLALLLPLGGGCSLDPYTLHLGPDARPDALVIDAAPRPDVLIDAAPPDACIPAPEVCDLADNDCDGEVDEGFNLAEDPGNCGSCGHSCAVPGSNTLATCDLSSCVYECLPGYWDLDTDPADCEYACVPTNCSAGVCTEVCDGFDNDCDGEVDDGFDLMGDESNCGVCNRVCTAVNGVPECQSGSCGVSACDEGYADVLPAIPGCEYTCPRWDAVAHTAYPETCNNIDDDCDGVIDDGVTGLAATCGATDVGACAFGHEECNLGVVECVEGVGPAPEICDTVDNDCDGAADEGFNFTSDPRTCGGCSPCDLDNAVALCNAGVCEIRFCLVGYIDVDGVDGNGCERACSFPGPEVCDGVDNDCDDLVDAADPDFVVPPDFCLPYGECAAVSPTCAKDPCDASSATQWRCLYGGGAETDGCGNLVHDETFCDTLDGDCDGVVDDSFTQLNAGCGDGLLGICQSTGTYQCNSAGDGVECLYTHVGETALPAELCNGLDDDCDGTVDEDAAVDEVRVTHGLLDFYIYAYEASRPDAAATAEGVLGNRACSRPAVLPWRNISWTAAAAACAAGGARLCTEAEWEMACTAGVSSNLYPYGATYLPGACNGEEYDPDCALPDHDLVQPTGKAHGCPAPSASLCESGDGVFDLSGNLKEWTSTAVGATYRIRGGSYDNVAPGLTCEYDFTSAEPDYRFTNLGFRCCRNP